MAAVLACGDGALLAGRAAAYLLGVVKGKPPPPEVVAPGKRRVPGVRTWRTSRQDATIWRGIPVTSVPRTLVDLAPYLPEEDLARACHEAGIRHHTTPAQVEAILARRHTPGATKLRAVMTGETKVTLTKLERRSLRWPRAARASDLIAVRATHGSRTAAASARPAPEATSFGATPTATSSSTRSTCWPSCGCCFPQR